MNRWHASTELQATDNTAVTKTVYTAAGLEAGWALSLALDAAARLETEVAVEAGLAGLSDLSGMSDTSG